MLLEKAPATWSPQHRKPANSTYVVPLFDLVYTLKASILATNKHQTSVRLVRETRPFGCRQNLYMSATIYCISVGELPRSQRCPLPLSQPWGRGPPDLEFRRKGGRQVRSMILAFPTALEGLIVLGLVDSHRWLFCAGT
jgi:hypothetical protein